MAPKPLSRNQLFILMSVLCSIFLAALDQTIVATAAPQIAADLGNFEAISWIFSAYMLSSTVMIPIYGKLSDIHGRRIFYLGGILIFLTGSVVCGAALSMPWMIAGRCVQGLGAGAIMVESFTIIGDLFPPAERGKWQGVISSIFGLASIVGPLLGGVLTDYASWRLVFFINLPVGALAMLLVHYHFPQVLKKGTRQSINYVSAALLALSLLAFLFALVRSEVHNNWQSFDIVGLFVLSSLFLLGFIVRDRRAHNPIFPKALFENQLFNLSIVAAFFMSVCMFAVISYVPLFAQMALLQSASGSGWILIPFVLAMTIASAVSGQIVSRTGKYKILLVMGMISIALGMYCMSQMNIFTTKNTLAINLIFAGSGIGISMPIFIVIVQSSFGHDKLGLVTSSMQLIRNIGATLGTALLGTLIINYVEKHLLSMNVTIGADKIALSNLARIVQKIQAHAEDKAALLELRHSFAHATNTAFFICFALALLALVAALFTPVIVLRKTNGPVRE